MVSTDENYTPSDFVGIWRDFMGGFDLDPFSCEQANQAIQASTYWTVGDDALSKDWSGYTRKWVNPPYSRGMIAPCVAKAIEYVDEGTTLILVNSSTSAKWYQRLLNECSAVCFLSRRLQFTSPSRPYGNSNRYDQTLFYFGSFSDDFAKTCSLNYLGRVFNG